MGSGTTAVAAKLEGRRYIGMEQSDIYCRIARERIKGVVPATGTPPPPMPTVPPAVDPADIPSRGHTRAVYQYIRDAMSSRPDAELRQQDIADALGISLPTVNRAVRRLRKVGLIDSRYRHTGSVYALDAPRSDASNPDSARFPTEITKMAGSPGTQAGTYQI